MSATICSVRPCCRPRVVVARASKIGRLVGVVAGGFAAVGPALAESTPRLENLTYDATNALSRASPDASDALSQLNAGDGDATPLIAGLAVGILVVGAGLKAITDEKGAVVKGSSPADALKLLGDDKDALILDIRSKDQVRTQGQPDLKGTRKSLVAVPYSPPAGPTAAEGSVGTVSVGWAERIARMKKVKNPNAQIVLLDADGSVAGPASRDLALAAPDVKAIVRVEGGAERWQAADLPWKEAGTGFTLPNINLDVFKTLQVASGANKTAYPELNTEALIAAALVGGIVLLFTEVDYVLQLIGIGFVVQFTVRKLLFAEQREKTINEFRSFVDEKIAAREAGQDLRRLADAVLEVPALGSVDLADRASDVEETANVAAKDLAASAKAGTSRLAQAASEASSSAKSVAAGNGTKSGMGSGAQAGGAAEARQWIEKWRSGGASSSAATQSKPAASKYPIKV